MDWFLVVSSFRHAGHLYGKLIPAGGSVCAVYVDRVLTADTAARLNADDGRKDHKPGDHTERFHDRDDLINHAIDQWRSVAAAGDVLLLGSPELPDRPVIDRADESPAAPVAPANAAAPVNVKES